MDLIAGECSQLAVHVRYSRRGSYHADAATRISFPPTILFHFFACTLGNTSRVLELALYIRVYAEGLRPPKWYCKSPHLSSLNRIVGRKIIIRFRKADL